MMCVRIVLVFDSANMNRHANFIRFTHIYIRLQVFENVCKRKTERLLSFLNTYTFLFIKSFLFNILSSKSIEF